MGRRSATLLGGLVACALALAAPAAALADGGLAGRTVVVDPGHGGADGGATAFGRLEKDITLPIGLDLGAILRGDGARVVYTRRADITVSLAARTTLANDVGAAAFVAIHANAFRDPAERGTMTFYGPASGYVTGVQRSPALVAASRSLARDVQAATLRQTGALDQGVQTADYYVLGNALMPSILIETGFLTNPTDGANLADPAYQQALAAGIAGGLEQFFSGPAPAPVPAPADGAGAPAGRYLVRPGDTLSAIALRLGVAEAALRRSNDLADADRIFAGRALAVPAEAGGWTAGPVDRSPLARRVGGQGDYTVRPGDTLSALALRFHVSQAALAAANGLRRPDDLLAGRTLRLPAAVGMAGEGGVAGGAEVPAPRRYVVRPGDTLSGIALRFGLAEGVLARANGLRDLDRVLAGQVLRIPGA